MLCHSRTRMVVGWDRCHWYL